MERKQLRSELAQLMTLQSLSQSQIANQIGKSTAVVNQYLKGTYAGDNVSIDSLIGQLLARYQAKKTEVKQGYVTTNTSKAINNLITLTHATSEITLVIGEAGLGKTMALYPINLKLQVLTLENCH
ncbi:MAG: hypothetical protein ACWIPH_05815 [Ostreibacterium sp.]